MVGTQATKAPPSLLYMVKQVELVVRSHLDELVRPYGITALQYTALTVLERHDGLSAAQLARDSFVTAQSIADLVRTLESRELIRRERNSRNRRELEERMVRELTTHQEEQFRTALSKAWHALS